MTIEKDMECFNLLTKDIGLDALLFLVSIEEQIALLPATILKGYHHIQLVTSLINSRFNTQYSHVTILSVRNNIDLNRDFITRLRSSSNFDVFIKSYCQENNFSFSNLLQQRIYLPYTLTCLNCNPTIPLEVFQPIQSIRLLEYERIQLATIFKGTCKKCKYTYGLSCAYNHHTTAVPEIIVTVPSLSHTPFFHVSGDIAFSRKLLEQYSDLLTISQAPFHGFAKLILNSIRRYQPEEKNFVSHRSLADRLQNVWMKYELCRFRFMLGKETLIKLPYSFEPKLRDYYFESNFDYFYHLFVTFWTRHKHVQTSCDSKICSKVMITDGHSKPRRLICSYDDIVDNSIEEMGPINIGCPFTPIRKPSNCTDPDHLRYKYCYLHQHLAFLSGNSDRKQYSVQLQQALEIEKEDIQYLDQLDHCTVYRRDCEDVRKCKSFGLHLTFLSCGVVIAFDEAIRSEGMRKVTRHLLRAIKHGGILPPGILYDAACSLKLHWQRWKGTTYLKNSIDTEQLPQHIAIDKFHQKNHVRAMCQDIMRYDHASHNGIFTDIDTQTAEHFFSYLTKFKSILRCFSYPRSIIYCLLLFHLYNCDITAIDPSSYGIAKTHFYTLIKNHYTTDTIASSLNDVIGYVPLNSSNEIYEFEEDKQRETEEEMTEKDA
ncbi:unnamed protein product [Rotaria sp. Silwood1]|nr:unnamed protein product [Rotaria sp. Silwood1]CAF3986459.1 unnamed protein product [Rotaria sp. Silwood1]CAF4981800.1 unnamed protein product [Rotaria sp. Silwood1]CAF5011797.1 unnamed protein product [Rotaria sp. Silwood1]